MGKYDKILPSLPRMTGTGDFEASTSYQEKVNLIKNQILAPPESDELPITRQEVMEELAHANKILDPLVRTLPRITAGRRHASELAKAHALLRRTKEALEEHVSNVSLLIEAHNQLLVDQYENEGTTSLKLEDGDGVSVQVEPYAQVTDRDAVREWAVASGLERSLTLPWQTLNSHTKELLLLGEPAPPGTKVWARPKIVFKRG